MFEVLLQGRIGGSPAIRVARENRIYEQDMARNSSVEAMQNFASLLRKPPADLLIMLRIDED